MRPFDLELAKAGHPLQTSNGRPARIICYDRKNEYYPIVALVENPDFESEDAEEYTIYGRHNIHVVSSDLDLYMAPIKREGWINVCYDDMCRDGVIGHTSEIYETEELAKKNHNCGMIIKIEWEA